MTSRACSQPMQAHESRARVLSPASGAYSHVSSPAVSPLSLAAGKGRGARLSLRPLDPRRSPEHSRRRGLPSLGAPIIHLQLRVSLHAERNRQALNVDQVSHLRRVSLPAARRCRVQP